MASEEKKYWKFTDEVHPIYKECRRIVATKHHHTQPEGSLGGFVEHRDNLRGRVAWVGGSAVVREGAVVYGSARVVGSSEISGRAEISGAALVCQSSKVSENCRISGSVRLLSTTVSGYITVIGNLRLRQSELSGVASFDGPEGWAVERAKLTRTTDLLSVSPVGPEDSVFSLYRSRDGGHRLTVGCWTGTVDTLMDQVRYRISEDMWEHKPQAMRDLWYKQYENLEQVGYTLLKQWELEDQMDRTKAEALASSSR